MKNWTNRKNSDWFFSLEKTPYFWIIKLKTKRSFFYWGQITNDWKELLVNSDEILTCSRSDIRRGQKQNIPISPWSEASNSWFMKTRRPNNISAILLGYFLREFFYSKNSPYICLSKWFKWSRVDLNPERKSSLNSCCKVD